MSAKDAALASPAAPRLALLTLPDPADIDASRCDAIAAAFADEGVEVALLVRFPRHDASVAVAWAQRLRRGWRQRGLAMRVGVRLGAPVASALVDAIAAAGVDWVHLGGGADAAASLRARLAAAGAGGCLLTGAGHRDDDLAARTDVDATLLAPVLTVAAKPGVAPLGWRGLAAGCAASPRPVLALGGLRPEHAPKVVAAGAAGMALMGAAWRSEPRHLVAALRDLRRGLVRSGSP